MRRLLGIAAALLALGFRVWLFPKPFLEPLGRFLVSAETPVKSDCVFVFAGDLRGQRLRKASELYQRGLAAKIFVSGPGYIFGQTEDVLAIAFARGLGYTDVPYVGLPHEARSTVEEARLVLPRLRDAGCASILAVTSDFHTRRAGAVAARHWPGIATRVVEAPTEDFEADGWWQNRTYRKTFLIEWLKTFAHWFGA